MAFQSTHPVWGATPAGDFLHQSLEISIHAPRVGCDEVVLLLDDKDIISIHAPRVGCDLREMRHMETALLISIHAPRVGCDFSVHLCHSAMDDFNPRTPCGVRLHPCAGGSGCVHISIHAPRVGCDGACGCIQPLHGYFNPRTPCGVRPASIRISSSSTEFQSTHPVWGATAPRPDYIPWGIISIHAPRVGCDLHHRQLQRIGINFNPRTPCGVRPRRPCAQASSAQFQSTHPVWGATRKLWPCGKHARDFNPRTPCGVRPIPPDVHEHLIGISIHAPRVGCDP